MISNRKYNVSVDPAANDRMIDHIRFLARVSVEAAERLYEAMAESINSLNENPGICPLYAWYPSNRELRYKLCGKRYRIVFEIIDNDVFIYDIQDCRQDMDKNLL